MKERKEKKIMPSLAGHIRRLRISIRGAVQGVGFRPFVYRLATDLMLTGWVVNTPYGVSLEVEGWAERIEDFSLRLDAEMPEQAVIYGREEAYLDPAGYKKFEIRESHLTGKKTAFILPDIATCPACRHDIFDSENRRYRYPFTNCTHCGPRFTIIESLPYDRVNTSMKSFKMCPSCREEYDNPKDRRFHAQPNACPACGPQVEFWDNSGRVLAVRDEAMMAASEALLLGRVLAVKGLGGFHLMTDASNLKAVALLRTRKLRAEKPFAIMVPDIEMAEVLAHVSTAEKRLLQSPEAPIVLLKRKPDVLRWIAPNVAPQNPYLGVMLPSTPLHHLLLHELRRPMIATSGNLSDEVILKDEKESVSKLGKIADAFLMHNRPIVRHADDSIVRVILDRPMVLRRARGYAPMPVSFKGKLPSAIAVGAHMKNTVAVSTGQHIFLSQNIGDLETAETVDTFDKTIRDLTQLYEIRPVMAISDLHPSYISTQRAQTMKFPGMKVQHHYAHVLSCMAENEIEAPVLGIAWDGTGYGLDETIWGGEFLEINETGFRRAAHLRTFSLPGGDRAVMEPRRSALGLLYQIFGDKIFSQEGWAPLESFSYEKRRILKTMLASELQSPKTSSAGRLFDAVASILNLVHKNNYEGQAGMALEFIQDGIDAGGEIYPYDIETCRERAETFHYRMDWEPMILAILKDLKNGESTGFIAAKFHETLAVLTAEVAKKIRLEQVVLTGGCFQNKTLLERSICHLRHAGFKVYWHQRIPPNDGGIALGQIVAAAAGRKNLCA